MPSHPTSVEIRSFQVGFGDCFLLTFVYGTTDRRHVLIDFGTTGLPRRGKPSTHMPRVAQRIAEIVGVGGRLTAVVATHRHADHISGFATDNRTGESGKIIRDLRPRLVLQPWTEDPDARTDASEATRHFGKNKGFVASLAAMNQIAARVELLAAANPPWMSAAARRELSFLGADNLANRSAVDNLIAMGQASGAKARYLRYGDDPGLDGLLPGVNVRVFGPPDLTQTAGIRQQRSKDRDEFWQLLRQVAPKPSVVPTAPGAARNRKRRGEIPIPASARWFRDRLQTMSAQALLEIVRQLDDQMNNTSLILAFEVNGKKLLFPGDAQLENWSYALTEAEDSEQVREWLADVDFYKVGHHGSLNATPRKLLWEHFRKRSTKTLQTMMSTMAGKHGKTESQTEVPRRTLVTALKSQSRLLTTQTLKVDEIEHLVVV